MKTRPSREEIERGMIDHTCQIPYCSPDEGIHCIPNQAIPLPGVEESFAEMYARRGLEVLRIQPEADVTDATCERFYSNHDTPGMRLDHNNNLDRRGYLIFLRQTRKSDGN